VLDDVGLAAAIRTLGHDFERDSGVSTTINTVPIGDLLHDDSKTAMYRIAQEALTNITKYAQARQVTMSLTTTRRHVHLEITDDGIGFDQKNPVRGLGLGLRNMQERIDSFGGKLVISSRPNAGTKIKVAMPIQ
jgi:two-component system NarL family sensor kinase